MKVPKHHFRLISAPEERAAIEVRKYREGHPHWVVRDGNLWVLVDETYKAWKAARTEQGKEVE